MVEMKLTEETFYTLIDAIERAENIECSGIFYEDLVNDAPTPKWIRVETEVGFNCYQVVDAPLKTKIWDLRNDAVRKANKVIRESVVYRLALPSYSMLNGDHLEHRAKLENFSEIADKRLKINGTIFELLQLGVSPVLYRARISANRFMSYLPSECEPVNNIENFFSAGKTTGNNGVRKIVFNIPNLEEQIFYFNQRGVSRKNAVEEIAKNYTRFEINVGKIMANVYQPVN